MAIELIAVVNERDEVVSVKPRSDIAAGDIFRVAILWLENPAGEVLLQQRALTKKIHPSLWSPAVAGTVAAGETPLQNIIRETAEELGLQGISPQEVGTRLYRRPDDPYGRIYTFYRATASCRLDELALQTEEVADVQWIPKAQLFADVAAHPARYVPTHIFWRELYC